MEHANRKMSLPDAARLALDSPSTAKYYTDQYLEQQVEFQSKTRKFLAEYAMKHAPEARRQVEKVLLFWQTEGHIEGLELDLRIADWRARTAKGGS